MGEHNFTDEDKQKVIDFLNMVAEKAKFELDTKEVIRYYGLLSFMQKTLLKKVDLNVLEVKRVVEAKAEAEQPQESEGDKE